jgi:restriction endonuclease S subunit
VKIRDFQDKNGDAMVQVYLSGDCGHAVVTEVDDVVNSGRIFKVQTDRKLAIYLHAFFQQDSTKRHLKKFEQNSGIINLSVEAFDGLNVQVPSAYVLRQVEVIYEMEQIEKGIESKIEALKEFKRKMLGVMLC